MNKLSQLFYVMIILALSIWPSEAQEIEDFHEIMRFSQIDGHEDNNAPNDCSWGGTRSSIVWNPDSTQIATLSHDQRVYIWDIQQNELIHTSAPFEFGSFDVSLIWKPDNSLLIINKTTTRRETYIGVWDVWSQEMLAELTILGRAKVMKWSRDGTNLATLQLVETSRNSINYIVHIWETNTWQEWATWEYDYEKIMSSNNPPDPRFSIGDIALNADGSRLAVAQEWYGGGVEIVDTMTGELVNVLEGDPFEVVDYIEWSPIGDQIIGRQGLLRYGVGDLVVWDITTGETLFV